MRHSIVGVLILLAGLVVAAPAATGIAVADPLPVPYANPIGPLIGPDLLNADAAPAGANDFACHPSAEHPEPVVLVPGTGTNAYQTMSVVSPALVNAEYCVFAAEYGRLAGAPFPLTLMGGLGPFDASVAQLSTFVDHVLAVTGARKVAVVGHSQGTLIPALYLKLGDGAGKVSTVVSVGPALAGSPIHLIQPLESVGVAPDFLNVTNPVCEACFGTDPGAPVMRALHDGGPYVPGTAYTNIASRYDPLAPPVSSLIPGDGVTNIALQDYCPNDLSEHASMIVSPVVTTLILNALDPEHPVPVRCVG